MAAAGRLTFLYPQLVRAASRSCGPTLGWATTASTTTTTTTAATTVRWNSLISKRHGKAVESAEWEKQQQQLQQQKQQEPDGQAKATQDKTPTDSAAEEVIVEALAKSEIGKLYFEGGEKKASQAAAMDAPETDAAALKSQQQDPKSAQAQSEPKSSEPTSAESEAIPMGPPKPAESGDSTSTASAESTTDKPKDAPKMSDKLDSVFYMGAPEKLSSSSAPSMSPPNYVHHFDSYSLVKQLQEGGYSNDQAITLMKAVRALLAHNLDMAQERLVSKSDVENVRWPQS